MISIVCVMTDWWSVGATIISGIITAIATVGAVIYTNHCTKKQLVEQEEKHRKEQMKQFEMQRYVVIKPNLLCNSFLGILDQIIVQNDYSRVLLLTGDDGFDFFDDENKRKDQTCRMLMIENGDENDVESVVINTKSVLLNMSTEERCTYETYNAISLLRRKESIIVRLANQAQYTKILEMNKEKIPSQLDFDCKIEYSTLANQRITYIYQIKISNDNRIEIIQDRVAAIKDEDSLLNIEPTICRNLQDYISSIDRSNYYWQKVGQAQMLGIMSLYNATPVHQGTYHEDKQDDNVDPVVK